MLNWATIEPTDMRCPTLWLVGSENKNSMDSIAEYQEKLKGTKVEVQILEGLNHSPEFTEIEKVLPVMLAFTTF